MPKNDLAYVITGAPGSGKTSILRRLSENGMIFFEEPARAIIAEQRSIDGQGIYDRDPYLFKELILSRAVCQYQQAQKQDTILFFDRGIPDIIAYSQCFGLPLGAEVKAAKKYRYNKTIFFAPIWRDIFSNDKDRKLSFEESKMFGEDLKHAYKDQGYELVELPLSNPNQRAKFILDHIRAAV